MRGDLQSINTTQILGPTGTITVSPKPVPEMIHDLQKENTGVAKTKKRKISPEGCVSRRGPSTVV